MTWRPAATALYETYADRIYSMEMVDEDFYSVVLMPGWETPASDSHYILPKMRLKKLGEALRDSKCCYCRECRAALVERAFDGGETPYLDKWLAGMKKSA